MSSLRYFSSERHSENSGTKTTRELATHVLPPLKFCRCAMEKDVPAQDQLDGYEDVKGVVHYQGLSYVLEIIRTELISRHHDEGTLASRRRENSLRTSSLRYFSSGIHSGHFGIETIRELVARKYYGDLQCCYRYLSIAETTREGLPMSTDWKDKSRLGRDCLCLLIGRPRATI